MNHIICEGTNRTQIICIAGINIEQNPPKHVKLFKGKHSHSLSWINQGEKTNPIQPNQDQPKLFLSTYRYCVILITGKTKDTKATCFAIFPCFSRKPNIKYLAY